MHTSAFNGSQVGNPQLDWPVLPYGHRVVASSSWHVPEMQAPAHLSCWVDGLHGVPSGAGMLAHCVPEHIAPQLVSLPHSWPSMLERPYCPIGKHAILPAGWAGSGMQMPWHSVSGPVSSGSQACWNVPVWQLPDSASRTFPTGGFSVAGPSFCPEQAAMSEATSNQALG